MFTYISYFHIFLVIKYINIITDGDPPLVIIKDLHRAKGLHNSLVADPMSILICKFHNAQ